MHHLSRRNTSKHDDNFEDDEIFDDSTFLANFDNTSFKQANVSKSNVNDSINNALNVSALCCDEEISGYDKLTGRTWIYPTNYPVRDYQFNIIKAALVKNTMVSLPTGLGKTFIAAVIMYNFYRWYPLGKIVFTAPTRPLVAQQIDACYNIIAIPPNDTIEMTGHMAVNVRKSHWQNKRVFFATPQVIYNDLKSGICPSDKIRCLVFDEAHRARGNYAYCQIVATLDEMGHKTYRMLALSATPGSKVDDVINVVKSLHIAHLELRTENCIDVAPYSHSRKISTVIVPLGPELTHLRQQYVEILDGYARRLKQFNILPQNLGNLSKGRIVMLYKEYQTKDRGLRHPQHNYIMKDFTILISLYHGLELLVKHGSRVFLNFFDEHPEKSWIQADDMLTALLERLRDDLGVNPLSLDRSILPDGTIPEMPQDLCFGHPKFDKLKSIIMDHFRSAKQKNQDTRAIIFCEYRESVNLVHCLLLQCRPLVTPQMFVGQGASGKEGKTVVSQKQQLRVMRCFREGQCNTLVATCVAEEGLDVGSVDLILCFDISTRSPIRLVQRCGRTGRERGGQVYILVTEGREHQTLIDCMRQRDGLNKKILQSKEVEHNLYKANPRMMPRGFTPECQKMFISVAKKDDKKDVPEKTAKKGQKDLRSMLLNNRGSTSGPSSFNKDADTSALITEAEFNSLFPEGYQTRKPVYKTSNLWAMNKETLKAQALDPDQENNVNLSSWLEWQRSLQKTVDVGHSKDSVFLTKFLQKCDAKRIEYTQMSQPPVIDAQVVIPQNDAASVVVQNIVPEKNAKPAKKKIKTTSAKTPTKNNGDIRALFSTATKSTKNYTKLINDLGIPNDGSVPTSLLNLLVDLNLNVDSTKTNNCFFCQNVCDCKIIKNMKKGHSNPKDLKKFLVDPVLPDLDLINEIDAEAIVKCKISNEESEKEPSTQQIKIITTNSNNDKANCSTNFDLEFDLDALDVLETPSPTADNTAHVVISSDKNFDLGDIDDIFNESSPEEAKKETLENRKETVKEIEAEEKPTETEQALGFFGLDSIEDIFADYEDDVKEDTNHDNYQKDINCKKRINDVSESSKPKITLNNAKATIKKDTKESELLPCCPLSPSLLSGKQVAVLPSKAICLPESTDKKQFNSSTPKSCIKSKPLQSESDNNNIGHEKGGKTIPNSATDRSMFTITQIMEMINNNKNKSIKESDKTKTDDSDKERSPSPILLTQADRKQYSNKNASKVFTKIDQNKTKSLIILDSDSDDESEQTQSYNVQDEISKLDARDQNSSQIRSKRKLDEDSCMAIASSPYFNKKLKLDTVTKKPLTLQEKVLAALSSNKANESDKSKGNLCNSPKIDKSKNNQTNFQVAVSPPHIFCQKENLSPLEKETILENFNDRKLIPGSPLEMLQKYRKENKLQTLRSKFDSIFKSNPKKLNESPKKTLNMFEDSKEFVTRDILSSPDEENRNNKKENTQVKRKITFVDSEDEFMSDDKNSSHSPMKPSNLRKEIRSTTNHKVRKKKRPRNSFIDMEASLSDDGLDSGDELSDDSAGSIADFIDDNDMTRPEEDIRTIYLKSVRSPVKKNGFKIPELPSKYKREDIFSQFVEEDAYEMDSFCVDSHVGLTQVNDMSELELAEIVLEEKRRTKKKGKPLPRQTSTQTNGESPLIRKTRKNIKRRIESDSDDSS